MGLTTREIQTLDDLAPLGPEDLMNLYVGARTPALEELDGKMHGRMLAARLPHHA